MELSAESPQLQDTYKVRVIVPTHNGGAVWRLAADALGAASAASRHSVDVLVVDSSSRDNSVLIAKEHGFRTRIISSADFNHGGTRNAAATEGANAIDIVLFLTQDAIIKDARALDGLIDAFEDQQVAVAYGRQLPHDNANPIATHARLFNYPTESYVCTWEDKRGKGIKAAFTSNSFAAYRLTVFVELGGFPENTILSEDMYFAARALMAGYKVAYVAESAVHHSHNYSPLEELRRYFDIGVFHHEEAWIAKEFGGAGGEGKRFLQSEFRYLLKTASWWLPRACVHNALKIVGYKLGKNHHLLPQFIKPRLSMTAGYWKQIK